MLTNFKMSPEGEPANVGAGGEANRSAAGGAAVVADTTNIGAGNTAAAAGGAATSWLDSLPEDIKKDPSLQTFKDPVSLAKSWVNAQKMIGADKVVIPGDKASEEERNAFFQKLGRPEAPDKYEFKPPQGVTLDDAAMKSFKESAFKLGLTGKQAQAIVEFDVARQAEAQKGFQAMQQKMIMDSLENYKKELGGNEKFQETVDRARVAVRALADDKFKEFLVQSQLGSRPEAIEFFAKLATMMSEDKLRDGTGVALPPGGDDPAEIQKEIASLEEKIFANMASTSRQEWVEQRSKLYERLELARARKSA